MIVQRLSVAAFAASLVLAAGASAAPTHRSPSPGEGIVVIPGKQVRHTQPTRVTALTGEELHQVGTRTNPTDMYNDTGAAQVFYSTATPNRAGDDFTVATEFATGGLFTAFSGGFVIPTATQTFDMVILFYNHVDPAVTPVNSMPCAPVAGFRVAFVAQAAGAWTFGPVDLTGLNGGGINFAPGPDGQGFVDELFLVAGAAIPPDGTPPPNTLMPTGSVTVIFPFGQDPSIGTNQDVYWRDSNNNGHYDSGTDARGFGDPAMHRAAFYMDLTGKPNSPPSPTVRCCTTTGCSVRRMDDCLAAGGTFDGTVQDCGTPGTPQTFTHNPNAPIPDNDPAGVSDTITVSGSSRVADANISVTIPDHTFIGDLVITITHNSITRTLWNGNCGGNDGMDVTFDDQGTAVVCATPTTGVILPAQSLLPFLGGPAGGDWTLHVVDTAAQDTGTLTAWSLIVAAPTTAACGPSCPVDINGDGTVNVSDFLAYLSLYAAGNSRADFNGDGQINVQDFLAFLAAYAHGC
jgi:subtilisin-like proprotein convertase family protein